MLVGPGHDDRSSAGARARFLVAPQASATDVVERLRLGEQGARAPVDNGSAEVRSVAVALNALADEVQAWREAQDETERLRRTSVDISRAVREELTIEAVLRAVPMIGPALLADRCWLRLVEDGGFGAGGSGVGRPGVEPVGGDIPMAGDDPFHLAETLWRRGEVFTLPYLSADLDLGQRGLGAFVASTGARSLLVVPVGAGEQLLGLLGLVMTDRPARLDGGGGLLGPTGRRRPRPRHRARPALRAAGRAGRQAARPGPAQGRLPVDRLARAADSADLDHGLPRAGAGRRRRRGAARCPQMLHVVDRNAGRLGALIDDLLLLSRIEEGSLDMGRDRVTCRRDLGHAADTVRPQADAGGVRLTSTWARPGSPSPATPGTWRSSSSTSLSNAVKFTPAGRPGLDRRPARRDGR